MNPVAGAIVVEAADSAQKCEPTSAVAFAGTEPTVVDDISPGAMLAHDTAQLHPGKQIAAGGIQPDDDLAVDAIQRSGKPIRRVSVDRAIQVDERGIPEHPRARSGHDLYGHPRLALGRWVAARRHDRGCLALGDRGADDRSTGLPDRQAHEREHADGKPGHHLALYGEESMPVIARSPDLAAPDQTSLHLPRGAAHEIERPRGKRVHVDQLQVVAAIYREAESVVGAR